MSDRGYSSGTIPWTPAARDVLAQPAKDLKAFWVEAV